MDDDDQGVATQLTVGHPEFRPIEYGHGFYRRWGKRALDVIASLFGLVVLSPLLLLCGLLVRVTSRGPVFFRQIRLGRRGCPFKVIKFRTMRQGAEQLRSTVVVPGDERLTPAGGFLRRTKFDEMPQLINVLLGDMSLVGPRPRVPEQVDLGLPEELALLTLRPGITSYASLYHRREAEYCSQQNDPHAAHRQNILPQKTYLDGEYLKNLSFWLDLNLIFSTIVMLTLPSTARPRVAKFFGFEFRRYGEVTQMGLEAVIFAAAIWVAYWLRYEHDMPAFYRWQRTVFLVLLPLVRIGTNRAVGIYKMIWRYANLIDAAWLAASLGVVSAVLLFLRLFLPPAIDTARIFQLPVTVLAMEYLLAMGGCLGLRGFRRALYEMGHRFQPLPTGRRRRLLIVGAGLSGLGIALEIVRHPHLTLVGFVDDDVGKEGCLIAGYSVLGPSAKVDEFVRVYEVDDVIVAVQSLSSEWLRKLTERCRGAGTKVHVIPSVDQILGPEIAR